MGPPRSGLRGYGAGLLGAAVFVGDVVALVFLAELAGSMPSNTATVTGVRAVAGTLVWWPVLRLLVGGRVGWRDLLPGAVVAGVGQAAVMALASLVLRPVLISQAHRFGAIGVAFAMVTALTVLGVLMVVGAVLGRSSRVGGRDHARRLTPCRSPAIPTATSASTTSGAAKTNRDLGRALFNQQGWHVRLTTRPPTVGVGRVGRLGPVPSAALAQSVRATHS